MTVESYNVSDETSALAGVIADKGANATTEELTELDNKVLAECPLCYHSGVLFEQFSAATTEERIVLIGKLPIGTAKSYLPMLATVMTNALMVGDIAFVMEAQEFGSYLQLKAEFDEMMSGIL